MIHKMDNKLKKGNVENNQMINDRPSRIRGGGPRCYAGLPNNDIGRLCSDLSFNR